MPVAQTPAQQTPSQPSQPNAATPAAPAAKASKSKESFTARHERAGKMRSERFSAPAPAAPTAPAATPVAATPAAPAKPAAAAPAGTEAERLDAAGKALEANDLVAVAKALGMDTKLVDTSGAKFNAIRRQADKVRKDRDTVTQAQSKVDRERIELNATYGDPKAMRESYLAKNYHAAAKWFSKVVGDDFATVTRNIARATSGMDPAKLAELEKTEATERENKRLAAELERTKNAGKRHASRQDAIKTVSAKCAGHEVMKLTLGAELVLKELEDTFDADQGGSRLSFKQAADAVLQRKRAEFEALGWTKLEAKEAVAAGETVEEQEPAPSRKKGRVEAPAAPDPNARKTRSGKVLPSFEERQARAERLTVRRKGGA